MNKSSILSLAFFTIVVLGGLGYWLIPIARGVDIVTFFKGHYSIYGQVVIGTLAGSLIAFLGWQIVELPYLASVKSFFVNILKPFNLNIPEIIFISICAGMGEELLFRGVIQAYLGIWVTSIIFVALHGYLHPRNLRISIYGVFMTFSIAGLGYLTEKLGIVSAIAAHTIVDVYLLHRLMNA